MDVTRISDSCGYGVPLYEYLGDRSTAIEYANNNSTEKVRKALSAYNAHSIDGLDGISEEEANAYVPPLGVK